MASEITTGGIAIERGSPFDWWRCRHTCLVLRHPGHSLRLIAHIARALGCFQFQTEQTHELRDGAHFFKEVQVGALRRDMSRAQIAVLLAGVEVDNWGTEFNCQNGVGKALVVLKDAGYISAREYEEGFGKMWEATLEGADGIFLKES